MKTLHCLATLVLAAGLVILLSTLGHVTSANAAAEWSPTAAASHMDERQQWWMNWPKARRDHETACVSCHTALPYAMGRASLRQMMGVKEETAQEKEMLGYIRKRVGGWNDMEPFYGETSGPRKSVESRVTESVLNALILARYDSLRGSMSASTKTAFENMWSTQLTEGPNAGGWEWLNFHNAPWEGETSAYYGASLAALAVGYTPTTYQRSTDAKAHLVALRGYLQRSYEEQPLLNKTILLWSSHGLPGVLTRQQQTALVQQINAHQSIDGGWSIASMGEWKRRDNTPIDEHDDAYATSLCLLALRAAGEPARSPEVQRGVSWLQTHQDSTTGMWTASSLNKNRPPESDPALFMSDASTGFAVLALQETH